MEYITPKDAAEKWGIGLRRVQRLCADGRIPGSLHMGKQWLIPANAERPKDGRTIEAKSEDRDKYYHFPALIYSKHYVNQSELNEEEKLLLKAQILNIQANYIESNKICNDLQKSTIQCIRFGAYCANMYNYMLLGLQSELAKCEKELLKIYEESSNHKDDYLLAIAAVKFQYTYDSEMLKEVNVSNLSEEALLVYQLFVLQVSVFRSFVESEIAINIYCAFSEKLEKQGIMPAAFISYAILAIICERSGQMANKNKFIKKASKIGYNGNFCLLLSKYSSLNPSDFYDCYSEYGNDFVEKIKKIRKRNIAAWSSVVNNGHEMTKFMNQPPEETEIMLLLSYGLSDTEICELKNINKSSLDKLIRSAMKTCSVANREELVNISNDIFKTNRQ